MPRKRFAESTQVSVDKSIAELIRVLNSRGADKVWPYTSDDVAAVQFEYAGRLYRIRYPVPPFEAFEPTRWMYPDDEKKWQRRQRTQERQRLWRVLIMKIKISFEEIDDELTTPEEVFLPYAVLPNNQTVGDTMLPMMERAYATGSMPAMEQFFLPAPRSSIEDMGR